MRITPAALQAALSGHIENFVAASTPGGIEAQEKAGQIRESFRETLPKQGCDKAVFEKLGFKFVGEGTGQDNIFWECEFPKDWRKQPTDHSMWSNLLDDKGRIRAKIFFKAAFYDYAANISLCDRFYYSCFQTSDNKGENACVIFDCGKAIRKVGVWSGKDYAKCDELEKEAKAWLESNYPDWRNPMAHWD